MEKVEAMEKLLFINYFISSPVENIIQRVLQQYQ